MPILFDQQNGRVARFSDNPGISVAMMTFLEPEFDYTSLRVLVSGLDFSLNSNYQLTDTLGSDAHLVSFGESVTPLPVSGLIFEASCKEETEEIRPLSSGEPNYAGVAGVIQWWEDHNLAKRQTQIRLTIGSQKTFYAYIANMRISIANAADSIWKFDMLLLRVPTSNAGRTPPDSSRPPSQASSPFPSSDSRSLLPFTILPRLPLSNLFSASGSSDDSGLRSPGTVRNVSQTALSSVSLRTDGSPATVASVAVSSAGYVANASVVGQLSNT